MCKYLGQTDQFANLPRSNCPNRSNIKYLHQTHQCASGMRGFLQLVCVHLCCWREIHFEYSLLPPGLTAAVTQLQHFDVKTTNIFAASEFHIIANIHLCSILSMCTNVTGTLPLHTVCSQFNHYVGLVNLSHASTCPMFPYVESNRVF